MKRSLCWWAGLCLAAVLGFGESRAGAEELVCGHGRRGWAAPDNSDHRKYAPSRGMDVLHLALDVTPDFRGRTVSGRATLRFKPVAQPMTEVRLDAVELRVTEVTASEKLASWQVTPEQIVMQFDPPLPADRETTVTVVYSAEPKQGLYFRTPELGYPAGDAHLWTQGEPHEARHWFPSFDSPNEKFTSEVTCRVREDMTVVSNGRLAGEQKDPATGLKAVRWVQEKPHVNYLIALVAGYFKKIEGRHRDIPMAFWTVPSQIGLAERSFRETADMMVFFEKEIGVPYPWAKYDQVCVADFGWGGMENTTLTILNDGTLHTADFEELRESRGLVAHELAHQWFGDLVTCKDWSHLWLNEGFATYYTHLYEGHKDGRDEFLYGLLQSARGFLQVPNDTNAIVRRDFQSPEEQFGFHAYPKGAWILHMLRNQLGEDLFRRCIRTYLERHQFGTVVTEDLNRVLEELSGRSFDQFFDQYVYHAHQPALAVSYSWDERTRLARVSVRQEQKLSDDVLLFNVPLTVRFKGRFGVVDRELAIREKAEDFHVPLPSAPEIVRIDPNLALLARITFTPPVPMLLAQLGDRTDTIGRLLAAEQLSGRREALGRLREVLNGDPFHGVRLAASASIRAMPAEEGLAALLASVNQKDARVRRQVANDIAGYHRDDAYAHLVKTAREERNPDIRAAAVRRLGSWSRPEVKDLLLGALGGETFRGVVEEAALSAMRAQEEPAYVGPVLAMLARRETNLPTAVVVRGLEVAAWLARNEEGPAKAPVREFLENRVNSPRERVRGAALASLGTLGDPRATALLEKFAAGPKESPERKAAERALVSLRETRRPSAELGSLRNDLMTLQRENRDLRKDMEDLRKRLDNLVPKAAGATSAPPATATGSGGPRPAGKPVRR